MIVIQLLASLRAGLFLVVHGNPSGGTLRGNKAGLHVVRQAVTVDTGAFFGELHGPDFPGPDPAMNGALAGGSGIGGRLGRNHPAPEGVDRIHTMAPD